MSLSVAPNEHGLVRVFALSMTDAEARALRIDKDTEDPAAATLRQSEALGLSILDSTYTEVFPVSDLDDLGLSGYLIEGNGVAEDAIAPDRRKLDAIEGWVLIAYSRAFAGAEVEIKPSPALTLIGTYQEPRTDWTSSEPLTAKSATEPAQAPEKKRPSDAAMMGRIATLVLLVLALLTWLMIWIAG